jgi:hypothetical protein
MTHKEGQLITIFGLTVLSRNFFNRNHHIFGPREFKEATQIFGQKESTDYNH